MHVWFSPVFMRFSDGELHGWSFVDSQSPTLYAIIPLSYGHCVTQNHHGYICVQGVILSPLQDTLLCKYFVVLGKSEQYLVRIMAALQPAWFQFQKDVPANS